MILSTAAFLRFHRRAGARVALRANAMIGAIAIFIAGSAPEPAATLRALVLGLVARGYHWQSRAILAAVCFALAAVSAPRITLGTTGWLRSLPASSASARRAAVLALVRSQLFAIVFCALAVIGAAPILRAQLSVAKIASLPVLFVAVAMATLRVRGQAARPLAAMGALCAAIGSWPVSPVAILCLIMADRVAGPIEPRKRRRVPRPLAVVRRPTLVTAFWHWSRLTWTSLDKSDFTGNLATASIPVAFAYFIVINNNDLDREYIARTVHICGSLSVAGLSGLLANLILRGRPAWPWVRSLPWSSTTRIVADSAVIGLPILVIPVVLARLDPVAAMRVATLVPISAICAAGALRNAGRRQTGAAGATITFALAMGMLLVLWPFLWVALLALVPLVVRAAAAADRRMRVTRWDELHHLAAGDPNWSSGL